jgi:hypothetical protein
MRLLPSLPLICLCCCSDLSNARAGSPDITADEIMRKAVAQAQINHAAGVTSEYAYRKTTTTEVLDDQGQVKDRKEKIYLVSAGRARLQHMRCNGEVASPEQLKKEERFTSDARKEVTDSKSSRDESWEKFLTRELMAKYAFTLAGVETVNGRWAYVLDFCPKGDDLPVRTMADRVLNRLAGRIWVDQDEFEIAKATLSLQSQATLGGLLKVVGALKRFDYTIERVRFAQNVWFNRTTRGEFESRKLWDSSRIRTKTETSGFQRNHAANG